MLSEVILLGVWDKGPLRFTPDGRFVAYFHRGLRLLDLRGEPGSLALRGHRGEVTSLVFRFDGRRLYSGGNDGVVRVWDAVSGLVLRAFLADPSGVSGLAVSPDGKRLATCTEAILSGGSGSLRLWDAETGKLLHDLKGWKGGVGAVAFTTDGKQLISGSGKLDKGEIILWEVESGKRLKTIPAHKGTVMRLTPSPDGVRLATAAVMEPGVKVWNLQTGTEIGTLPCHAQPNGLAYHPSGMFLAVGSNPSSMDRRGQIQVWDLRTQRELHVLTGHNSAVAAVAFSPDGVRLASGAWDGSVRIWDMRNGQEVLAFQTDPESVHSVAFSPGGTLVAAGGHQGTIRLLKAPRSREEVQLRYRTGWSTWDAARTGGRVQAAREEDGSVRVWSDWRPASWHLRRLLDTRPIRASMGYVRLWSGYTYAVRAGDGEAGYRRVCAELLRRFGDTRAPLLANGVAWLCALAPSGVADPAAILRLAERAVAANDKHPALLGTLGLVLYRCGKYNEAIEKLEAAIKLTPPPPRSPIVRPWGVPEDRFVLALAHARLGHKKEAEDWLGKGVGLIEAMLMFQRTLRQPIDWQQRLEWRWLRQEAEAAVKSIKPRAAGG